MGRGSSGQKGSVRSVIVNYGIGAGQVEYRKGPGGRIFDVTNNRELSAKMSLSEIAKRARENGYRVEVLNAKETAERDEARKKENRSKPDYELGMGVPWGNKEYRKTARRNRMTSRSQRRR